MIKYIFTVIIILMCVNSNSFAQPGYGTEVSVNFVLPVAKNAEEYSVGPGALVGFYYDITENLRLALIIGYLRVELNEDKVNGSFVSGGLPGNLNVSGGIGAIPAIFSLRFISPGPGMRLYGLLEGGLYTYSTSITGTYTIGTQTTKVDQSEFRSEPGVSFGGGVLFPLNQALSLDFNVRYHWVRDSEYLQYGAGNPLANSRLISLGVGLNWFFPL